MHTKTLRSYTALVVESSDGFCYCLYRCLWGDGQIGFARCGKSKEMDSLKYDAALTLCLSNGALLDIAVPLFTMNCARTFLDMSGLCCLASL